MIHIFTFKSETNETLRAFAGDSSGSKLPAQLGPWQGIGVIRPDKSPPHNFPRPAIEKAIKTAGFQLWRVKLKEKAPAKMPSKASAKTKAKAAA